MRWRCLFGYTQRNTAHCVLHLSHKLSTYPTTTPLSTLTNKPSTPPQKRARVVLPDAKHPGSDKDVVVWLDTSFAVASEDEAMQRGAVAALQAVAGERSLDYVLPQVLSVGLLLCFCGVSVDWLCVVVLMCVCVCGDVARGGESFVVCCCPQRTCPCSCPLLLAHFHYVQRYRPLWSDLKTQVRVIV